MENKKIILLSVILIFSQIIGIPSVYKVWVAIIVGILLVISDFRRTNSVQNGVAGSSSTDSNEEKKENNFS